MASTICRQHGREG